MDEVLVIGATGPRGGTTARTVDYRRALRLPARAGVRCRGASARGGRGAVLRPRRGVGPARLRTFDAYLGELADVGVGEWDHGRVGWPGQHVPAGTPHAFANPGDTPARMLFQVSPAGHETYLRKMADLLAAAGPPDQDAIAELRRTYDIQQLTPLVPGR